MSKHHLDATTVASFEAFLQKEAAGGDGYESVAKRAQTFFAEHGWEWFTKGTKADFHRRFGYVFGAYSYRLYSVQRHEQLAGLEWWVFKANALDCPDHAAELGGLVLPNGHAFWEHCYPPLRPTCRCYVVGAGNEKGATRLGGIVGKPPPASWPDFDGSYTVETLLHDVINDNMPVDE